MGLASCTSASETTDTSSTASLAPTSTASVVATTTEPPEPEFPEPLVTTRLSVGMSRAVEYLAARVHLLQYPGQTVSPRLVSGESVCIVEDMMLRALEEGECVVGLDVAGQRQAVSIDVVAAPARSDVDRPGGNVLDIKPVYIRFSDSPDEQRDVNGQIASFTQSLSDFMAVQHPGFALRLDTHEGLPDVQHIELPMTTAEFLDRWAGSTDRMRGNLGPLGPLLLEYGVDAGIDGFYRDRTLGQRIDEIDRILVGIVEGPRGAYRSPNSNTEGGCGSSTGNAFVVYFVRDLDGSDCSTTQQIPLSYAGSSTVSWTGFDAFRLLVDMLNGNRGCDRIITNRYTVPLDDRPSSITSTHDPIGYPYAVGTEYPRLLDPKRSFYYKIMSGDFVGDPCTDIIYSPYLTDWFSLDVRDDEVDGRSTTDRPDDIEGPQVRVLYVLPQDGFDHRWDVDGVIHAAAATANDWLFANGQRTIRFDTAGDVLDVGFVRLPIPESVLWLRPDGTKCDPDEMCPDPRRLVSLLEDLGSISSEKIHVIVWGGQLMPASTRNVGCAGAMPDRNAVFMSPFLRQPLLNSMGCLPGIVAKVPDSSNTFGLTMIHEVFHVLGAVDNRAPDADGGYHIGNDPTDLMGGSAGIVKLDPNRRNYWDHGVSNLVDVTDSPFLVVSPSTLRKLDIEVREREWWMDSPIGWDPLRGLSVVQGVAPVTTPPTVGSSNASGEPDCEVTDDSVAATFEGSLPPGPGRADQPVGIIWARDPARCVAARGMTDDAGRFRIELPADAHLDAPWDEGGGYCLVWDENGDGRFDSFTSEPLNCTSDVRVGVTVRIDIRR